MILKQVSYLLMFPFEHNCKGTMANQVFSVELKLPNSLHRL